MLSKQFEVLFNTYGFTNSRTKQEYHNICNGFSKFCEKDFLDAVYDDAAAYMHYLVNDRKLSENTIKSRFCCLSRIARHISEHLNFNDIFADFFTTAKQTAIAVSHVPSLRELDEILEVAKLNYSSMYYIIISLVIRCALTATEIVSLSIDSVKNDGNIVYLKTCTGGKMNTAIVPDDLINIFNDYIKSVTGLYKDNMLFHNSKDTPLSVKVLDINVRKIITAAGYPDYNLRKIRGGAIVRSLKNADIEKVKSYTGLKDLALMRYIPAADTIKFGYADNLHNFIIKPSDNILCNIFEILNQAYLIYKNTFISEDCSYFVNKIDDIQFACVYNCNHAVFAIGDRAFIYYGKVNAQTLCQINSLSELSAYTINRGDNNINE